MSRKAWIVVGIVLLVVGYVAWEKATTGSRPHHLKAEADVRALASAVSSYQQHTGAPARRTD